MAFVLTPGERNEKAALPELMRQGAVKRAGRGRPKLRPKSVVGDRGYSGRPVRDDLRRRGISPAIPQLKTEEVYGPGMWCDGSSLKRSGSLSRPGR